MKKIEIKFTPQERDLIVDHPFADLELTKALKIAQVRGKYLIARYSIDELDDLLGFIAAVANHTEDKQLEKKFDRLYEKLDRILTKETDR
ncbi:MAG: hypothetical protein B5M56_03445 [Desulfococcus sp. 4484_241]|nr:MAG: hypothetical protein B5M56_03445 [Desulfococcus sp. 4484_241]RLC31053.1 MAG: hypothetical protein DRH32_04820 [Deltaproteobacteria bacterium]